MKKLLLLLCAGVITTGYAQQETFKGKFEQLGQMLPTPNEYRTGSGAPGPNYWQQRADYDIDVTLDDKNQRITGKETITYFNNSPDELTYLWLQLDQNVREQNTN
ncbi:MAG: M1 family peptidase, partial [Fulvivirga sp.]